MPRRARPQSMLIDARQFDVLAMAAATDENDPFHSFTPRHSVSRNSTSTVSSVISSRSSLVLNPAAAADERLIHDIPPAHINRASFRISRISPSSSTYDCSLDAHQDELHPTASYTSVNAQPLPLSAVSTASASSVNGGSSSSNTAVASRMTSSMSTSNLSALGGNDKNRRDFFGKMKFSLDRRRHIPWLSSSSAQGKSQKPVQHQHVPQAQQAPAIPPPPPPHLRPVLHESPIQEKTITLPFAQTEAPSPPSSSHSSSTSAAAQAKEHSRLREISRSASTIFSFRSANGGPSPSSTVVLSSSPESATTISSIKEWSPVTSPISEPSLTVDTYLVPPVHTEHLAESPLSMKASPVHDTIPEIAEENEDTFDVIDGADSSAQTTMHTISPSPAHNGSRLRSGPRARRPPAAAMKRPQTIVGFFRQSKVFNQPKFCDVFGMPLKEATMYTRMNVSSDDGRYWVPAILSVCVEFLNKYGLEEEGLYRVSGSASAIEDLKREFAFCGEATTLRPEVHDVHAVASFLKAYIRALPEEMIRTTPELRSVLSCHKSRSIPYHELQACMSTLPAYNLHAIRLLCSHFGYVAEASKRNRMTLSNLVLILCPTMRIDSRLFSLLVEDTHSCVGDLSRPIIRFNEQSCMLAEARERGLE
ncbi:uncharacterized protein V1518DRAFT_412409 [Limtongia smithiae]|uniref:uncharacterized protein n=1 Tax=Limtongia smithiae TaxID=1125753 RepID=UPI0034CE9D4F